jgi:hypothetical protein
MYLIMCALQHESYNEEPNITGWDWQNM